jgi:hypothetical protein
VSDLKVTSSVLDDLRRTFTTITGRLDGARRQLTSVQAWAVGDQDLIHDLEDFSDDWKYGITQIGQHADSTVKMIDSIGKTFDDADVQLANTLQKAGDSGGGAAKSGGH